MICRKYKNYRNPNSVAYQVIEAIRRHGVCIKDVHDSQSYRIGNKIVTINFAPNCNKWNDGRVGDWIFTFCE